MKAVHELERMGYDLTLEGEEIRARLRDRMEPPDPEKAQALFDEVKANRNEVVEYLKGRKRRRQEAGESGWRTLRILSSVLGKEIQIAWREENPRVVYVDRKPYTETELGTLKGADPKVIRAAHEIKSIFKGKVLEG